MLSAQLMPKSLSECSAASGRRCPSTFFPLFFSPPSLASWLRASLCLLPGQVYSLGRSRLTPARFPSFSHRFSHRSGTFISEGGGKPSRAFTHLLSSPLLTAGSPLIVLHKVTRACPLSKIVLSYMDSIPKGRKRRLLTTAMHLTRINRPNLSPI